jgi:hypothetical protein
MEAVQASKASPLSVCLGHRRLLPRLHVGLILFSRVRPVGIDQSPAPGRYALAYRLERYNPLQAYLTPANIA